MSALPPIVFSNSGFRCQALREHPCRAHCSLRGRACPPHDGVRRRWWINVASADFLERYAGAREAQADKYFQEIVEIADAATPETVNVARLRVDSRKFTVARLAPKKYGDHISHDVKGGGINFQPQILIQCSSAGDDEGYIDISAAPEAAGSLPQQGNGNSRGGRR
jgi:hypothetical protein